jgi:hypothetical protein
MKLIRLVNNGKSGSFINRFNEDIKITKNSKIGIQSALFRFEGDIIQIDGTNDRFQIRPARTIPWSTVILTHGTYTRTQLFQEIQNQCNIRIADFITLNIKYVGLKYTTYSKDDKFILQFAQKGKATVDFLNNKNLQSAAAGRYAPSGTHANWAYYGTGVVPINNATGQYRATITTKAELILGFITNQYYDQSTLEVSNVIFGCIVVEEPAASGNFQLKAISNGTIQDLTAHSPYVINDGIQIQIDFLGGNINVRDLGTGDAIYQSLYDMQQNYFCCLSFRQNAGQIDGIDFNELPLVVKDVNGVTLNQEITQQYNIYDVSNIGVQHGIFGLQFSTDVMQNLAQILGFRNQLYETSSTINGLFTADNVTVPTTVPYQILVTTPSISLDCYDGEQKRRRNILLNLPFDEQQVKQNQQDTSIKYDAQFPTLLKVNLMEDIILREFKIIMYSRDDILELVDEPYSCELNLLIEDGNQ